MWKQRFLQQPSSDGETSQCCPWHPKPRIICTDLKRSALNMKPTIYATTIFWLWNISGLCMTAKALGHRYWFEEVCFEIETNGFCNNLFLIVKRLTVVHDSKSLGTPALIWRGLLRIWNKQYLQQPFSNGGMTQCCPLIWRNLLRIWNQRSLQQQFSYCDSSQCCLWQPEPRMIGTDLKSSTSTLKLFLQQPFSYGETSQRCPWQQKPRIIGADLKGSAPDLKPTAYAATISYCETYQCCSWQPKPMIICTDLKRSASNLKSTVSATTVFWFWNVSALSTTTTT